MSKNLLVIQHLDFGELVSIDMLRDAAALFSFGKSSQEQGICSSRLAIALKAAGQCLTRKGESYLYGCKQSEISQIY